jgi:hypothetical protein
MNKNDTAKDGPEVPKRLGWSEDQRISWVEWRVRELTIRSGKYIDERGRWLFEEKAAGGRKFNLGDQVADYAVWLLHVRDDQSWHQLAYRFFPNATEEDVDKYEQRLRRVYRRIERQHPGTHAYKPPRLSERDTVVLQAIYAGVIPIYVTNR